MADKPDNRPGSHPEIKKLPRVTCSHCGIVVAKPMIDHGRCRNTAACEKRFNDQLRRRDAQGGK